MIEFPETHQQGMLDAYLEALPTDRHDVDFGVQIAPDGRVWTCVNGVALLRFKPKQPPISSSSKPTQFKLWYIHQVPGKPFEQEITDPAEGQRILDTIYQLMLYLYATKHIPDYANAGGIAYLDEDGEWLDYHPEEWADES